MAKSHRTSNDKELIRWNTDYGKIEIKRVGQPYLDFKGGVEMLELEVVQYLLIAVALWGFKMLKTVWKHIKIDIRFRYKKK